jgi:quercetin dioxygenase-like cupin family protein
VRVAPTIEPIVTGLEDQAAKWFFGGETWIRATAAQTGGALGVIEQVMPVGVESPYHVHHAEDESFYVIDGAVRFFSGEQSWLAGPGGFAFLPRDIPHGFRVEGDGPARVVILVTPGGFDSFVAELSEPTPPAGPPDLATVIKVAAGYNIEILGPLPS